MTPGCWSRAVLGVPRSLGGRRGSHTGLSMRTLGWRVRRGQGLGPGWQRSACPLGFLSAAPAAPTADLPVVSGKDPGESDTARAIPPTGLSDSRGTPFAR